MLPYVDAAQHKPIAAKQQAKQSQGTKQNQQQLKRKSRGGGVSGCKGQGLAELHTKQKPAATAAAGQLKLVTSTKRLQCAAEITVKLRPVARCVQAVRCTRALVCQGCLLAMRNKTNVQSGAYANLNNCYVYYQL